MKYQLFARLYVPEILLRMYIEIYHFKIYEYKFNLINSTVQ